MSEIGLASPEADDPSAMLQLVEHGDNAKGASKAAAALRAAGEHDAALVAALMARCKLQGEDWTLKELSRLAERARPAVAELIALLAADTTAPQLRARIADTLWSVGGAAAAVQAFDAVKDEATREAVLQTIGSGLRQGRGSQAEVDLVLPTVSGALATSALRMRAIIVLREIGPRAKAAVAPMARLLAVASDDTQAQIAYALVQIGADAAVEELMALLGDEALEVRVPTAQGLGCIRDETIVGRLITALDDPDERVRATAANALFYQGDRAVPAVGALTRLLVSENDALRAAAAETLGGLGDKASAALPALQVAQLRYSTPAQRVPLEAAAALIGGTATRSGGPGCPLDELTDTPQ